MAKVIAPFWFVRRTNQCKGQGAGPLRGSRGAEPRVGPGNARQATPGKQRVPGKTFADIFAPERFVW